MNAGCALFVVGTGVSASVYSYMNGELKRSYPEPFDKTVQASTETVKNLNMTITKESSEENRTIILAKRPGGIPITLKIEQITPEVTEVSIRSGVIGLWNIKVSELIHANIAQRL